MSYIASQQKKGYTISECNISLIYKVTTQMKVVYADNILQY